MQKGPFSTSTFTVKFAKSDELIPAGKSCSKQFAFVYRDYCMLRKIGGKSGDGTNKSVISSPLAKQCKNAWKKNCVVTSSSQFAPLQLCNFCANSKEAIDRVQSPWSSRERSPFVIKEQARQQQHSRIQTVSHWMHKSFIKYNFI